MAASTKGKCYFCNKIVGKTAIKRHIDSCKDKEKVYSEAKTKGTKTAKYFTILIQDYYTPLYWIYVDIPTSATLKNLDTFLRDVWLECCGHLSSFKIDEETYNSSPDTDSFWGKKEQGMNYKLYNVLSVDTTFIHEYDFGSTTRLKLKVVSEYERPISKKKVEILARNLPPEFKCSQCDKAMATNVCADCGDWICDECSEEHECGEEMLLPVVNSPRVGVCGYCGNEED